MWVWPVLIGMCAWDDKVNLRASLTNRSLKSLYETVDFTKHKFVFVDNGSTDPDSLAASEEWVAKINEKAPGRAHRILLPENRGTAYAVNLGWHTHRLPGEGCLKVDSDITWEEPNWADRLEEATNRHRRGVMEQRRLHESDPSRYPPPMPLLGLLGLKRSDCGESMYRTDWGQSHLFEVHHLPGERWIDIEVCNHVMGSCVYHTPEAMEKVGFLYQGDKRLYAFDDSIYCDRCHAAGLWTAFLHGFTIHHIDPGDTPYQKWKEAYAGEAMEWRLGLRQKYFNGEESVYYDHNGNNIKGAK